MKKSINKKNGLWNSSDTGNLKEDINKLQGEYLEKIEGTLNKKFPVHKYQDGGRSSPSPSPEPNWWWSGYDPPEDECYQDSHCPLYPCAECGEQNHQYGTYMKCFTEGNCIFNDNSNVEYSTIQAALDAASTGNTIRVTNGTYVENIVWPQKSNLKLIGISRATCIISGGGNGSVIDFLDTGQYVNRNTLISEFTLRNGQNWIGAGILLAGTGGSPKPGPTLNRLTISNNHAAQYGGGISIWFDAAPFIEDCVIRDNTAEIEGGGVDIFDTGMDDQGYDDTHTNYHPVFNSCTIKNNYATDPDNNNPSLHPSGGGVSVQHAFAHFYNTTIFGNAADSFGGGVYIAGPAPDSPATKPHFHACNIKMNTAFEIGGGVFMDEAHAIFKDETLITRNESVTAGGGLCVHDHSYAELTNTLIADNSTAAAGGVLVDYDSGVLCNFCTIANNVGPGELNGHSGNAVLLHGAAPNASTMVSYNSIFWGEYAQYPATIGVSDDSQFSVGYSDIQDENVWESGCIDADPIFCTYPPYNYKLSVYSPCQGGASTGGNMGAYNNEYCEADVPYIAAEPGGDSVYSLTLTVNEDAIDGDVVYFGIGDNNCFNFPGEGHILHIDTLPEYGNLDTDGLMGSPHPCGMPAGIRYTPNVENFNGQDSFRFYVTDAGGVSSYTVTVQVYVNPINDPPVLAHIDSQETDEDTPKTIEICATDVDAPIPEYPGHHIVFTAVSQSPSLVTTSILHDQDPSRTCAELTMTPVLDQYGDAMIVATVSDGQYSDSKEFTLTIGAVDDAPWVHRVTAWSGIDNTDYWDDDEIGSEFAGEDGIGLTINENGEGHVVFKAQTNLDQYPDDIIWKVYTDGVEISEDIQESDNFKHIGFKWENHVPIGEEVDLKLVPRENFNTFNFTDPAIPIDNREEITVTATLGEFSDSVNFYVSVQYVSTAPKISELVVYAGMPCGDVGGYYCLGENEGEYTPGDNQVPGGNTWVEPIVFHFTGIDTLPFSQWLANPSTGCGDIYTDPIVADPQEVLICMGDRDHDEECQISLPGTSCGDGGGVCTHLYVTFDQCIYDPDPYENNPGFNESVSNTADYTYLAIQVTDMDTDDHGDHCSGMPLWYRDASDIDWEIAIDTVYPSEPENDHIPYFKTGNANDLRLLYKCTNPFVGLEEYSFFTFEFKYRVVECMSWDNGTDWGQPYCANSNTHPSADCDNTADYLDVPIKCSDEEAWVTVVVYDFMIGIADFVYETPDSNARSVTVNFYDNSIPAIGAYIQYHEWDFGDGGTSAEQDPVHTYSGSGGIYQVTLTTTDNLVPSNVNTTTKEIDLST